MWSRFEAELLFSFPAEGIQFVCTKTTLRTETPHGKWRQWQDFPSNHTVALKLIANVDTAFFDHWWGSNLQVLLGPRIQISCFRLNLFPPYRPPCNITSGLSALLSALCYSFSHIHSHVVKGPWPAPTTTHMEGTGSDLWLQKWCRLQKEDRQLPETWAWRCHSQREVRKMCL